MDGFATFGMLIFTGHLLSRAWADALLVRVDPEGKGDPAHGATE
jgi:hypothetical protein